MLEVYCVGLWLFKQGFFCGRIGSILPSARGIMTILGRIVIGVERFHVAFGAYELLPRVVIHGWILEDGLHI